MTGPNESVQKVIMRLQEANRIMEELIDMAMVDNRMSEDEKGILSSINSNMKQYAEHIMSVIADGEVTSREFQGLASIEGKIIADAQSMATRDDKVSPEEKKLLNELVNSIRDLSSL